MKSRRISGAMAVFLYLWSCLNSHTVKSQLGINQGRLNSNRHYIHLCCSSCFTELNMWYPELASVHLKPCSLSIKLSGAQYCLSFQLGAQGSWAKTVYLELYQLLWCDWKYYYKRLYYHPFTSKQNLKKQLSV